MPDRYWFYHGATLRIPPIFAIAWIDPRQTNQQGQEAQVARFAMTTLPQRVGAFEDPWKTQIRALNSSQIWLIYQMLSEETTVPGPGHAILQALGDTAWVLGGNGQPITFVRPDKPPDTLWRIYDQRLPAFRQALIDACAAVFAAHEPFGGAQGIFLDQAFIHSAITDPTARAEMLEAMQNNILALRNAFPEKLIVANSSLRFAGANGGMDEDPFNKNRQVNIPASYAGQALPRCELLAIYEPDVVADAAAIRSGLAAAQTVGASFGAGNGGQFPHWLSPDFDDVMAAWNAGN